MEEYYPPYDRWFENRIYPSKDGLSIFFSDITDRKKAEQAMHKTQDRNEEVLPDTAHAQAMGKLIDELVNLEYRSAGN